MKPMSAGTATVGTAAVPYEASRLTVAVDVGFEDFQERFERAVPRLDAARFDELRREGATWETVGQVTASAAPHDFLIYWRLDATPLMGLAGHHRRCVEYLMGNHMIAERMFRHDPAVLLYAPLRLAIHDDADGRAHLAIDQPSAQFASFGDLSITQVGLELDQKLAALLTHLRAPIPDALAPTTAASG
jgi:hypothetical protein